MCQVHIFKPFSLPGFWFGGCLVRELAPRTDSCFPFQRQHHSSSAAGMCSVGKGGETQERHLLFLELFRKAAQICTNNGDVLNPMQFVNVHFHGNMEVAK